MAAEKKSFIAYSDWKDVFDELPDEDAGKLIKHIFSYVNDENPESDSVLIRAVFANIKTTLKRDLIKWESQINQRKEAGKASVEARRNKKNEINGRLTVVNETERNLTVNVNDTVNDTDILLKKETKDNSSRFTPPSLLEVQNYIIEKEYLSVSAASFWNFYESKNWFVGKNKMKDWKKAIAGWESRNKDQNGKSTQENQGGDAGFRINR